SGALCEHEEKDHELAVPRPVSGLRHVACGLGPCERRGRPRATCDGEGGGRQDRPEVPGQAALTSGVEVVVDRVSKSFEEGRIRALADVSFRLEAGDFVSLTGPSGGGKSTLLNLIGALDRPDAGTISVGGER